MGELSGINSYKVGTIVLEAIAIGLMAPVYYGRGSTYESCYLAFLCVALIITFLYLLLVVVLKVIQESANVVLFDKAYHIIMFILLVAGWGLYVSILVDYDSSPYAKKYYEDYDKQMALRICSLIFSGFDWLLFIYIIYLFFH